jgi:hypothetical protein
MLSMQSTGRRVARRTYFDWHDPHFGTEFAATDSATAPEDLSWIEEHS